MRVGFQEDLDQLEASIHEEGTLVLRSLRGALNALVQQDEELADEVIAFDDEIDARYLAVEEGIQELLARQTPVASDLRLVLSMLHVNLHLERIGDYCVTIAKLVKLAPPVAPDRMFVDAFEEMGARAEEMIRVALDSFAVAQPRAGRDARRPRRADRPREPALRPAGALVRARPEAPRVGPADDHRLAVLRADRRPRGRHRRADGVPRLRRVPRVHGRLALDSSRIAQLRPRDPRRFAAAASLYFV